MRKPLHALDWIKQSGCYLRTISAAVLRTQLGRRKRECTWCGAQVAGQKRTWCSKECVNSYLERCSRQHVLYLVRQRDRGICALCGVNALELQALADSIAVNVKTLGGCINSRENAPALAHALRTLQSPDGLNRRSWRKWYRDRARLCNCIGCVLQRRYAGEDRASQADHIVPVCEGGGLCDLSGYRTLCTACHKAETAKLTDRRRTAKPRKRRRKPNRRRR